MNDLTPEQRERRRRAAYDTLSSAVGRIGADLDGAGNEAFVEGVVVMWSVRCADDPEDGSAVSVGGWSSMPGMTHQSVIGAARRLEHVLEHGDYNEDVDEIGRSE